LLLALLFGRSVEGFWLVDLFGELFAFALQFVDACDDVAIIFQSFGVAAQAINEVAELVGSFFVFAFVKFFLFRLQQIPGRFAQVAYFAEYFFGGFFFFFGA